MTDARYSKDQLLDLFKTQQDSEGFQRDSLISSYVGGWEPHMTNGGTPGGWNRRDDSSRDHVPGSDVCWDQGGSVIPLGLVDLTDEEKEVCGIQDEGRPFKLNTRSCSQAL